MSENSPQYRAGREAITGLPSLTHAEISELQRPFDHAADTCEAAAQETSGAQERIGIGNFTSPADPCDRLNTDIHRDSLRSHSADTCLLAGAPLNARLSRSYSELQLS
jgi:hypothetical protein